MRPSSRRRSGSAKKGSRLRQARRGRGVGVTASPASGRLHPAGSIQAQLAAGESLSDGVREENLRYWKNAGKARHYYLFLIDTSGSMLSRDRLAMVKGCVCALLEDAYVKRIRVAVISYGGGGARLDLPFTASQELAASRIGAMKGGGSTPLIPALSIAARLIEDLPDEDLQVILLSDGRYNRQQTGHEDRQIRDFGAFCRKRGAEILFVDAGPGNRTARERSRLFAAKLQAQYRRLDSLRAEEA